MVKALFNDALKRVLVNEGEYVNHPQDPGGATMKGVTQRTFNAYLERHGKPKRNVKTITTVELRAIYRFQYADLVRFDELPAGVDYAVLDGAVNSGPVQAVKWLQRALTPAYKGKIDGEIGGLTIEAATKHRDHDALIDAMLDKRLAFLKQLKTWKTFGKGWTRRLDDVEEGAQAWASGSVPGPNEYRDGGAARAPVADIAEPAAPVGGPTVGAGGGIVAATLETARQQIEPLTGYDAPPLVNTTMVVLTAIAAAIAIAGVLWGLYVRRRNAKIARAIGAA